MVILSVIMPTYNKANFLDLTLASFVNQSHKDFEIILIDDGSTDNTSDIFKKYQAKINLKYIKQENKGRSIARNVGLELAGGKYILFNDDDRIAHPHFIAEHIKELDEGDESTIVIGWKSNILTFFDLNIQFRQNELIELLKGNPGILNYYSNLNGEIHQLLSPELFEQFDLNKINSYTVKDGHDNFLWIIREYGDHLTGFLFKWLLGTTANMSMSRSFLDKVGGFDTSFVGWGMEDTDLSYRLVHAGGQIKINRKAYNFHQYHPRPGWREVSSQSKINAFHFCEKHNSLDALFFFKCYHSFNRIDLIEANQLLEVAYSNEYIYKELLNVYRREMFTFKNLI